MKKAAIALALILGAFFIIRAIVELLTLDYSDPSSYTNDWGGPSLAGVLLVHCGLRRRRRGRARHLVAPTAFPDIR